MSRRVLTLLHHHDGWNGIEEYLAFRAGEFEIGAHLPEFLRRRHVDKCHPQLVSTAQECVWCDRCAPSESIGSQHRKGYRSSSGESTRE